MSIVPGSNPSQLSGAVRLIIRSIVLSLSCCCRLLRPLALAASTGTRRDPTSGPLLEGPETWLTPLNGFSLGVLLCASCFERLKCSN